MYSKTKIVCTIGPSVNTQEKILDLIDAGMNVARLNFSHGSYEKHKETVDTLKKAREQRGVPLAIMLDTKGPEIRIGRLKHDILSVDQGMLLRLIPGELAQEADQIPIDPPNILQGLSKGMSVLFHDGYISCTVLEVLQDHVLVEAHNRGELQTGKGVNIPNAVLDLPAMTERDVADIVFGCDNDIDLIAASFIRSVEHVIEIKKLLGRQGKNHIQVLAKIENTEGVKNFDSILHASDGIMIARGDLGVELPLAQVPPLQKMMVRKCYLAGKPSVTATQMLESMIHYPRPTRAEASDVANAIYDSTSAVMLSGETAIGRYPIEAVKVMRSIIEAAEKDMNYREFFDLHSKETFQDVTSSVTLATVKTAYSSKGTAIFAFTKSGSTARLISRFRPEMPVVAMTPDQGCYHQMSLNWGVIPIYDKNEYDSVTAAYKAISDVALKRDYVQYGDLVVLTAGSPFGISGTTNMMIVENIGHVLVRGGAGSGKRVDGKVLRLLSPESSNPYDAKGCILLINKCDEPFLPFIRNASGVILENHIEDHDSEKLLLAWSQSLNFSCLVRANRAFSVLSDQMLITLDPTHALVYKGAWNEL